MIRRGVVDDTERDFATVMVPADRGCESCSCSGLHGCKFLRIKAMDPVGVHAQDLVEVDLPEGSEVLAGLMLFLLPLLGLLIGSMAGVALFSSLGVPGAEAWGIASGFVCLVLAWLGARAVDRSLARKGKMPRIERVIQRQSQGNREATEGSGSGSEKS